MINGSRRKRIARGSGTNVQEVNNLLRQYAQMRKMFKQMGKPSFAAHGRNEDARNSCQSRQQRTMCPPCPCQEAEHGSISTASCAAISHIRLRRRIDRTSSLARQIYSPLPGTSRRRFLRTHEQSSLDDFAY